MVIKNLKQKFDNSKKAVRRTIFVELTDLLNNTGSEGSLCKRFQVRLEYHHHNDDYDKEELLDYNTLKEDYYILVKFPAKGILIFYMGRIIPIENENLQV